jgi:hypothetical protein
MSIFVCCECPEPPDYEEDVDDPLPKYISKCGCPTATLECVSESKAATLCGFSEFSGFESTPPKAFKKRNWNLSSYSQESYQCVCFGEIPTRTGWATIPAVNGVDEYDLPDCSLNIDSQSVNYVSYFRNASYNCSTGELVSESTSESNNTRFGTTPPVDQYISNVAAQIYYAPVERSVCEGSFALTYNFNTARTDTITLSTEDTEADALARATATAGTDCSSIYELRTTSFNFTVRTASYSVTANNLCKGRAYEGCVRLQRREAYSGTEPEEADTEWEDIEPDTIASFVATAKEMEIETDVALLGGTVDAIGYEYRAVSAHVWPVSAGCDCPTDYVAP